MAYKYYKAISDNGGTVGTQIISGGLNALFDTLTTQQQNDGITKHRKLYIESDTDVTMNIGINAKGFYESVFFKSLSDAEVVADLTGNEPKYGAVEIASSAIDSFTYDNTIISYDIFRDTGVIIYNGDLLTISGVIDNLDGTTTVGFTPSLDVPPNIGDIISSAFSLNLVANTPSPIWRINKYNAGAVGTNAYNSVDLIFVV